MTDYISLKLPAGGDSLYDKTFTIRKVGANRDGVDVCFSIHRPGCISAASGTLTTKQAEQVRDALIELLPLPLAEPAKKARPHGAQEYRGNGKRDWEKVTAHTHRLRVPGGWLYRDMNSASTCFVPVPDAVGYAV